jgi:hypothetical protein
MLEGQDLRQAERIVLLPVLRNSEEGPKESIPVVLQVRNLTLSEPDLSEGLVH